MENIHLRHLLRIIGDRLVTEVSAGLIQRFVDERGRELFKGHAVKPRTVRKAVATLRFVMNWAVRQGHCTTRFPEVELAFPKERQAEPFRTYDQIATIIARGGLDAKGIRQLWDGLFLDPQQVAEVLETAHAKSHTKWLHPFLVAAAHTGARRSELLRARIEDFDFEGKLVLLRELKRSRAKETFRTVDMTPFLEKTLRVYFETAHPGGVVAFCSAANRPVVDCQAWRTFRSAVAGSRWSVLRGYHAFRHSFASNLAAAGVDQRVIDELVGHSTEEMRVRYRHLFPVQRRAAVMSVFASVTL